MKTIIDFYPERISPPRTGESILRNDHSVLLTLKKGRNVFDESLIDQFRKHPTFIEFVKMTAILVVSSTPEVLKVKDISDFKNVNDAKEAIKNTFDKLQLETWLDQESKGLNRAAVISAVKIAIDRLDIAKLSTTSIS
jgi:hypothetical protein